MVQETHADGRGRGFYAQSLVWSLEVSPGILILDLSPTDILSNHLQIPFDYASG